MKAYIYRRTGNCTYNPCRCLEGSLSISVKRSFIRCHIFSLTSADHAYKLDQLAGSLDLRSRMLLPFLIVLYKGLLTAKCFEFLRCVLLCLLGVFVTIHDALCGLSVDVQLVLCLVRYVPCIRMLCWKYLPWFRECCPWDWIELVRCHQPYRLGSCREPGRPY